MKVRYCDQQDDCDPINGAVVAGSDEFDELPDSRRTRAPFLVELSADNGFQLMIGVGGDVGCAQYSRSDGDPPYLMAVSPQPPMTRGNVEFLINNTPTPIAGRYIISFDEMKAVALHFLENGKRSDVVSWQVLNPRANSEDAERPRYS